MIVFIAILSHSDKSRYEMEIQILTRKINDLLESIEKLTIQCDIHQSKLAGSRYTYKQIHRINF